MPFFQKPVAKYGFSYQSGNPNVEARIFCEDGVRECWNTLGRRSEGRAILAALMCAWEILS